MLENEQADMPSAVISSFNFLRVLGKVHSCPDVSAEMVVSMSNKEHNMSVNKKFCRCMMACHYKRHPKATVRRYRDLTRILHRSKKKKVKIEYFVFQRSSPLETVVEDGAPVAMDSCTISEHLFEGHPNLIFYVKCRASPANPCTVHELSRCLPGLRIRCDQRVRSSWLSLKTGLDGALTLFDTAPEALLPNREKWKDLTDSPYLFARSSLYLAPDALTRSIRDTRWCCSRTEQIDRISQLWGLMNLCVGVPLARRAHAGQVTGVGSHENKRTALISLPR